MSLPELRQRLDTLTSKQTALLDEILEDMDNPELNTQLKALAEEKQAITGPLNQLPGIVFSLYCLIAIPIV